jgi:hypothetical protein
MGLSAASRRGSGAQGSAKSEAAHVTKADETALLAHYERCFGEPSNLLIGEKESWGVHIEIHLFPPNDDRPFITAATIGMSALPLDEYPLCENCATAHGSHKHRAELIMYFDPNWDFDDLICRYPLLMMTYVARTPHLQEKYFGSGLSFAFPSEMVPEGSLLTNGFVTLPFLEAQEDDENLEKFDKFKSVKLSGKKTCDLYWLIPITTAECYVKRTQGSGPLVDLLAENEYFCLDIDRECFVEPENRHQRRARERAQRTRAKRRPHTSVYELTCEVCGHGADG